MKTALPLFAIGLIFGAGIGFTIAASNGITLDGHDHDDPAHHRGVGSAHAEHEHAHDAVLNIDASPTAPALALAVAKDPLSGWNLNLLTKNFQFSPQNASLDHIAGEGHAHVYVNGAKLGRFYGPWLHLDGLPAGKTTVEVTLNSNDHRAIVVGGRAVAASVTLEN